MPGVRRVSMWIMAGAWLLACGMTDRTSRSGSEPTASVEARAAVDLGDWHEIPLALPHLTRLGHAMAFDSARGKTVLYGGYFARENETETWRWNGTQWSVSVSAVAPPARAYHAMAFDAARGEIVLFGGKTLDRGRFLADTWRWNGTAWSQAMPATSPSARTEHAMASTRCARKSCCSAVRRRVVR